MLTTGLSQATFFLFLYQHVFYINGNFGKSCLSAKYKKVFDFLKMFVPETYERNPFFPLQNSFPMRTIQESLKTVIPCTLIKRLFCFQITEISAGWFRQKGNFLEE